MKKVILGLIMGLLLISCSSSSSDEDTASSSGAYKWSCKIDGVLYKWEGNHVALDGSGGVIGAGGQSSYGVGGGIGTLALQKLNTAVDGILVSAQFPNSNTGNFVFNSKQPFSINVVNGYPDIENPQNNKGALYSTQFGGTMNVNISSLSNTTVVSNPTNPGKVIGTFSGTIAKFSFSSPEEETMSKVTDGSFEAVRAQ